MTNPTRQPGLNTGNCRIVASCALPHLLAFAAFALCLTLPFALRGYHGDDGQFHFDSWIALRQAWLAGRFAPGWDTLANFTLGDARFAFYPPVSLWLGALLSLALPFKLAPAAFVWLALVLAGASMRAAASSLLGTRFALPAALLYMASPYLLMTALTRFAVAELLVLAWLPLIILHFVRTTDEFDRRSMLWLTCLLALSWLTNLPASIALAYVLLAVALTAAVHRRSIKPMLPFIAAEILALMVAAFALVLAFAEKGWITTAALLEKDFHPYLLFHSLAGFSRANFLLGVWVIACLQAAIIAATFIFRRTGRIQSLLLFELAAASLLFQLPVATTLWCYAPELRFVQFPFRFLAIMGAVTPLVVLGEHVSVCVTRTACAVLVLLALLPIVFYLRIPSTTPSNLPDPAAILRSGHSGTPEYTPAGASTLSAPAPLPTPSALDGSCSIAPLPSAFGADRITIDSPSSCTLRLPIYFYPRWRATDESAHPLPVARDATGLLLIRVPSGHYTVQVRFRMSSPARMLGVCTTLATMLLLLVGFRITAPKRTPAHAEAAAARVLSAPEAALVSPSVARLAEADR